MGLTTSAMYQSLVTLPWRNTMVIANCTWRPPTPWSLGWGLCVMGQCTLKDDTRQVYAIYMYMYFHHLHTDRTYSHPWEYCSTLRLTLSWHALWDVCDSLTRDSHDLTPAACSHSRCNAPEFFPVYCSGGHHYSNMCRFWCESVTQYKTIILPVVLYGCETCSLTLREEYKVNVFENRILTGIFGPKRDVNGNGEGFTMRNFIVYTIHLI